ncbi:hypothetical protein [Hoeflea sp.]|uniref:hypothetical protein n=1 Tax=Hoeflea sp. TaxID=1940281 RepID=UPI003B02915E
MIESKRFAIVPLDSSAAKIPFPLVTIVAAISSKRSLMGSFSFLSAVLHAPAGRTEIDRNGLPVVLEAPGAEIFQGDIRCLSSGKWRAMTLKRLKAVKSIEILRSIVIKHYRDIGLQTEIRVAWRRRATPSGILTDACSLLGLSDHGAEIGREPSARA